MEFLYRCSICKCLFEDYDEALSCESMHLHPEIVENWELPNYMRAFDYGPGCSLPDVVYLKFRDTSGDYPSVRVAEYRITDHAYTSELIKDALTGEAIE